MLSYWLVDAISVHYLLKKLSRYYMQLLTDVSGQNWNISNDQVKVAAKTIKANFFACELWVKRVGKFGVVS